jgi:hypothetical protein
MGIHAMKWSAAAFLAAAAAMLAPSAEASQTTYEYHIEHARYGDIGTYVNVVNETGDSAEVHTELNVAVKVLGIVMFREEARRTERWQGDRLVAFDSVTVTNGNKIEVHGQAQGDAFVVTTPSGTIQAPPQVHPLNPWSAQVLDTDTAMSPVTGHVERVSVSGGKLEDVTFDGKALQLHRYDVVGTKRQAVWLDDKGVAVAFRTEEDGSPVDFILTHPPETAPENSAQN